MRHYPKALKHVHLIFLLRGEVFIIGRGNVVEGKKDEKHERELSTVLATSLWSYDVIMGEG